MPIHPEEAAGSPFRARLYRIIFESNTRAGKAFDVALLVVILLSVAVAIAESVKSIRDEHGRTLQLIEWGFTILFTVEYVFRLASVRRPLRYATSFFGIIDLLAILPTWVSLMIPGAHSLLVVRIFRLLRAFRVLRLASFTQQADVLMSALRASREKITVFLTTVFSLVVIMGALMYVLEGPERGFDNIPRGMYWAVVTVTTVGYGDLSPQTPVGQFFASLLMILGYGIIAVPTGIVSVELANATRASQARLCLACGLALHEADAAFCKRCGGALPAKPG